MSMITHLAFAEVTGSFLNCLLQ